MDELLKHYWERGQPGGGEGGGSRRLGKQGEGPQACMEKNAPRPKGKHSVWEARRTKTGGVLVEPGFGEGVSRKKGRKPFGVGVVTKGCTRSSKKTQIKEEKKRQNLGPWASKNQMNCQGEEEKKSPGEKGWLQYQSELREGGGRGRLLRAPSAADARCETAGIVKLGGGARKGGFEKLGIRNREGHRMEGPLVRSLGLCPAKTTAKQSQEVEHVDLWKKEDLQPELAAELGGKGWNDWIPAAFDQREKAEKSGAQGPRTQEAVGGGQGGTEVSVGNKEVGDRRTRDSVEYPRYGVVTMLRLQKGKRTGWIEGGHQTGVRGSNYP